MANTPRRIHFSPGMIVRMGADALMVQAALVLALSVRVIVYLLIEERPNVDEFNAAINSYIRFYFLSWWPLALICAVVFYLSGFYTYGRFYQGRYKVLVIVQAVFQSFLIFGFVTFYATLNTAIPRAALVLAWLFTTGIIVGSRLWSQMWDKILTHERSEIRAKDKNRPTVLVIGGAGYIGSALVPQLLERGFRVRVLDMLLFGDATLAECIDHPELELIHGDFRNVETTFEAMRGAESVVHLGGIVGDPACNLDEELTIDINLSATRMVAELAKASGVRRFVFASTCSVYGACDEVLDERSRAKPISLYGHTKLASERVLLEMASASFAPIVLRFATIYGLSGRTRFDLVVNLLAAKAKLDGEFTVHGGEQWRPFIHVQDAARSAALVLEAPLELVARQTFNVGGNQQNYTIRQIGELVADRVIGSKMHIDESNIDNRNYRVSFTKIHNQLGFTPTWTVPEGIQQVLEAIASGEISDYREVQYSNAESLSRTGKEKLARGDWARELIKNMANE